VARPAWVVLPAAARPAWVVLPAVARPAWVVLPAAARPAWVVLPAAARPAWVVLPVVARPGWVVLPVVARPAWVVQVAERAAGRRPAGELPGPRQRALPLTDPTDPAKAPSGTSCDFLDRPPLLSSGSGGRDPTYDVGTGLGFPVV